MKIKRRQVQLTTIPDGACDEWNGRDADISTSSSQTKLSGNGGLLPEKQSYKSLAMVTTSTQRPWQRG